jgi:putative addiction module component (TIGR02574 family)
MGHTVVVRMPRLDLDKLSTRQKLVLIEQLWVSLDESVGPELTKSERDEIDRRLAEYDEGKVRGVSWPKAKKQIRKSLRRRSR